ncbi:STM3941 family protein [Chryseobacterium camelliae]|uniref:STM3941 family protein n=1 Tax=Chryseobacterium camelliae TaxID=1265445 RepID=UPI0028575416|nr:STM3941 family protein [Chryseobacterium camelliae]MDR6516589.1 hypothetical protein [Chryseobacterium camelliae]
MNEIHFYSSKIKSLILLILSSAFVYLFIHFYEELIYKSLFRIIISYLGCILFSFGIVYSMLILFRQKPLLTINNNEIIIYDPLWKKILVPFENVASFFLTSSSYRGINTSHQINIVLKNGTVKKSKIISSIFPQFENVEYAIQVSMLNIKAKKLMIILNSYLNIHNSISQHQKNKNES